MYADDELKLLSDEQLFRRVKDGDIAAFDELYCRYNHRLLHYLLRMLNGNESRAQDLLQDIFLRVLDKRNQFHDTKKFATWIYAITHNLCKNEYRQWQSRKTINLTNTDPPVIPVEDLRGSAMDKIDLEKFSKKLLLLLKNLPVDQRSTFLLRFQENLSIPAIAEILHCPAGTVKSRLYYTLSTIAERLKAYDPNKSEVL
jgi:RNA polymerase sigma-70 factor (ECF subfamily)